MNLIYQLSKWARQNPKKSRLIITLASILSAGLSYYFGIYLYTQAFVFPDLLAWTFCCLAILSFWFYPEGDKHKRYYIKSFKQRKNMDFLIYVIGVLLIVYVGNRRSHEVWNDQSLSISDSQIFEQAVPNKMIHFASSVKGANPAKPAFSLSRKEINKQLRKQIREFRKIIKAEIKELKAKRKKGERSTGVNVLLTILTLFLMYALGVLMVGLACSISCNGNGTLAAVVLILGWGGIIAGGILVIRKIFQRDPNRPREPKPKDNSYPY
ncbi:MAG: hypothetical protein AAF696_08735 [Bacteroidota bacterium]